jgi:hypothetical protein
VPAAQRAGGVINNEHFPRLESSAGDELICRGYCAAPLYGLTGNLIARTGATTYQCDQLNRLRI